MLFTTCDSMIPMCSIHDLWSGQVVVKKSYLFSKALAEPSESCSSDCRLECGGLFFASSISFLAASSFRSLSASSFSISSFFCCLLGSFMINIFRWILFFLNVDYDKSHLRSSYPAYPFHPAPGSTYYPSHKAQNHPFGRPAG
jgi:hypothetical protein